MRNRFQMILANERWDASRKVIAAFRKAEPTGKRDKQKILIAEAETPDRGCR